jgi:hypothetical protein
MDPFLSLDVSQLLIAEQGQGSTDDARRPGIHLAPHVYLEQGNHQFPHGISADPLCEKGDSRVGQNA